MARSGISSPGPPTSRQLLDSSRGRWKSLILLVLACISMLVSAGVPEPRQASSPPGAVTLPSVADRTHSTSRLPPGDASQVLPACVDCIAGSLSTGIAPWTPTYDSLTGDLYVANWAGGNPGNVTVISVTTDRIVDWIPVGAGPYQPAFNPMNDKVYISNYESNNVTVISGVNHTVVASIPVGTGPEAAVVDPFTGQVFISNSGDGTVSIIDSSTDAVSSTLAVGGRPLPPTYDPRNAAMYVPTGSTVDVISCASDSVVATIPVGGNPSVMYDPTNSHIYTANADTGNVSIISDSTDRVIATVRTGTFPAMPVLDPVTGDIFVVNDGSNNVSVISGVTNQVIATVTVGSGPVSPAYDPADGDIVVPNAYSNSVSFVSDATYTVKATLTVGSTPGTPAYVLNRHAMYVPNFFSSNLSVIALPRPVTYPVTFIEHGLPSNTIWGVTSASFGSSTVFTTAAELSFSCPNGSYWFIANPLDRYTAQPSWFAVTLSGHSVIVNLTFSEPGESAAEGPILETGGLVALGFAAGAAVATFFRRRRRPRAPVGSGAPSS